MALGEKAMSASFEKRLIRPAEWVMTVLSVATLLIVGAFISVLFSRAAHALFGWQYHFESIRDYLRLGPQARNTLFDWDRSFLFLPAAVATFYAAYGVQTFIEWAQTSPEQQRQQAQRRKREVLENHLKAEREKKAARKAAKKPMSGWRRLWIVLSIIFGVFAAIISWQPTRHDYVQVSNTIKTNDDLWGTSQMQDELTHCVPYSAKATYAYGYGSTYTYVVECDEKDPVTTSFLWALFPALLMAVVGLTVRWIYSGFRPASRPQATEPVARE